jgi:predicted porin
MKKLLIAAAAMSVVAGAQAQSSVTVYGLLDYGYSTAEYELSGISQVKRKGFATNSDNSSRWGFTGVEDLGAGLKASFKVESGIGTNPRSGIAADKQMINNTIAGNAYTLDASVIGNRELWAALEQGDTRVQLGYGVTALRNLAVQTSADGTNNMGNPINHDQGAYRRTGLSLSQKFGPVTATIMSAGNDQNLAGSEAATGESQNNKGYNGGLVYDKGPIKLGYGYDKNRVSTPAIAATTSGLLIGAVTASDLETETHLVAGSYDFGAVKVFGQWVSADVDSKLSATQTAAGEGKISGYSIGATVPLGKFVLGGQVFDGKNKRYVAAGTAENRDYTGYTARIVYNLSKRTYAYGVTGQYKTDAGLGNGGTAATTATATKYTQTSFGVAHAF